MARSSINKKETKLSSREDWPKCCICGKPKMASFNGKQYCNAHWQKMYMYGSCEARPRKRTNEYRVEGDSLIITTAKGEIILADADDYDLLSTHSWCISKTGYPVANINGKVKKISRYILGVEDSSAIVDHKNNNPLDNRKENLRICSPHQNAMNKSKTKTSLELGVRRTKSGKFNARIMVDRKEINLGRFNTLEEAITARLNAEDKYFGEYGNHNN